MYRNRTEISNRFWLPIVQTRLILAAENMRHYIYEHFIITVLPPDVYIDQYFWF